MVIVIRLSLCASCFMLMYFSSVSQYSYSVIASYGNITANTNAQCFEINPLSKAMCQQLHVLLEANIIEEFSDSVPLVFKLWLMTNVMTNLQ